MNNKSSVEWRRWVDEYATTVFKLNSIRSLEDTRETFNIYAKKSEWELRYNNKIKYYYVYLTSVLKAYFSEFGKLKNDLYANY